MFNFGSSDGSKSSFVASKQPTDQFQLREEMSQIEIWYNANYVTGLKFSEPGGTRIKKIGSPLMEQDISRQMTLAESETIVGVRCSLHEQYPECLASF